MFCVLTTGSLCLRPPRPPRISVGILVNFPVKLNHLEEQKSERYGLSPDAAGGLQAVCVHVCVHVCTSTLAGKNSFLSAFTHLTAF